ncbi:MAG: butyrate kinase [Candidatus Riflebacteria bacterium]|nr:butyrate kinase [Candidatus Riflebacteria bacterium]
MIEKKNNLILVINPGSTSTKVGIFEDEAMKSEKTLRHPSNELEKFEKIWDQYEFRKKEILNFVKAQGFDLSKFDCVVGRGGLLKPIEGGTYRIDQRMINDLRRGVQGHHASNLGGVLAFGIGWDFSIPSFIVDPPAVDEFEPISRISGLAEIPRTSLFHALNIKATARKAAKDLGAPIENLNLIIAHLGGGITIAAMKKGRVIDVNNGIGEGPFSPERSGGLPLTPFLDYCFSGIDKKTIQKKLAGAGGLVSYLKTNNAGEVDAMVRAGNAKAKLVFEAMAYQIACEIASRSVALYGKMDAIILTGGLAHSAMLTGWIEERCGFLGKILKYPGEDELEALALGGLRVLRGEESAKIYDAQKKTIGVYFSDNLDEYSNAVQALENRLRELGYKFRTQDENLELVIRNCQGDPGKLTQVCDEFLQRKVDLIVAIGSPAAAAAKSNLKGKTIPVIVVACFDPVVMGLIDGYAGFSGNITGSSYRVPIKEQIEMGILKVVPNLSKLGVVYKSGELQSEIQLDETREICGKMNIQVCPFDAQTQTDFPSAADYFKSKNVQAVFLVSDTTTAAAEEKWINSITSVFPTLCALGSNLRKGGLIGRIADWEKMCRKSSDIVVNVMEGASPSTIPIIRNAEAQTVLNQQVAQKLGINLSSELMESIDVVVNQTSNESEGNFA